MQFPTRFDVIVIGGGHAGTEAALASARAGARTLLLTHSIETLGAMSCNPSIGGVGKGHLVKEIDALGGVMAAATDIAGIQFRILNASKGPAVRATRAQADRQLYKQAIRSVLENTPNLTIFQQAADDLTLNGTHVSGVVTQLGIRFEAEAVVLTAGTFLNGTIHVGLENYRAGRLGDPASISLAIRLRERIKSIMDEEGNAHIVLIGDYNDEPFDHSLSEHLQATRDRALAAVKSHLFYNPFWRHLSRKEVACSEFESIEYAGSYFHRAGNLTQWRTFDQIMFSSSFLGNGDWNLIDKKTVVLDIPAYTAAVLNSNYSFDHLPIMAVIERNTND